MVSSDPFLLTGVKVVPPMCHRVQNVVLLFTCKGMPIFEDSHDRKGPER